ncbi:hypothetical protein HY374_04075 [Candidatus Berkelbacteria bacterium]|nr:hypothetical protein [Candidatus Berkelbacteria bacterium]
MNRLLVAKNLLLLSVVAVSLGVQIAGPQIVSSQPPSIISQAHAVDPTQAPPTPVVKQGQAVDVVQQVAKFLFAIFLALAVIFLILAAVFYLTAGGNQTRLDQAKSTLIYAIVAIVIALIAGGMARFIGDFLGVEPSKIPLIQ